MKIDIDVETADSLVKSILREHFEMLDTDVKELQSRLHNLQRYEQEDLISNIFYRNALFTVLEFFGEKPSE